MSRFTTKLTVVLAALALTLTAATADAAPRKAPPASAIQGAWITPVTRNDGEKGFTVILLGDEGSLQVINCDDEGNATSQVDGEYTYEGGVLTVVVNNKRISEKVLSANGQEMVTLDKNGVQTEWHRAKRVK